MKFRCLACGNTQRFWISWRGEVRILEDRHLDERSTEYPFDYLNPEDHESARLILSTPTFSVAPDAVLADVDCSSCETNAGNLRWIVNGREVPVPLGQKAEEFYFTDAGN